MVLLIHSTHGCLASGLSALLLGASLLLIPETGAVVTLNPADARGNVTPPQGALAGSGWELQGRWGAYLGTPVAPRYFIAATHIGGAVGQIFHFQGKSYVTTARFVDSESDLTLWGVSGTFLQIAPLNSGNDEVGQHVVMFGRGGPKGAPIRIAGWLGRRSKGWLWTPQDGVLRWGTNTVDSVVTAGDLPGPLPSGGSGDAQLLKMVFNADGGADEAHLTLGDSSGGLFIRRGGQWQLAGLNYAVDGPYNTSASGAGFGASIYDEGGLYKGGEGNWSLVPALPHEQGGALYSTRISSRLHWIQSILAHPPPEIMPGVQFQTAPGGPFVNDPGAEVDAALQIIRVGLTGEFRNYRLTFGRQLRLQNPRIEAGKLVFSYE